jgi:hypothetical protein
MRCIRVAALALAAASLANVSFAAVLFSDNFSTASLSNYTAISPDPTSSYATSGFDYSPLGIPSAPSSGDSSTLGLKLDANKSGPPNVAEAITLATNAQYSGDYIVTFDAWINVNGPFPDGGDGSTNFLTAGVGSNGTTNNFAGTTTGSGAWTAVDGENGSGVDYRLYKDGTLQGSGPQYAAGTRDGTNPYYSQLGNIDITNFPVQGSANGGPAQQNGTSGGGTFGMAWHKVKLAVSGGAMTWTIDNLPIGTLTPVPAGHVAIGYSDPTNNASDLPNYSFALIDNLVIVPEPATLTLCMASLLAMGLVRRR